MCLESCGAGSASHDAFLVIWSLVALAVFVTLFFLPVPYGRHTRQGWGPTIDSTWGWVWMEIAAVVTLPVVFYLSGRREPFSWFWLLLWEVHYIHRTFIFPFRSSGGGRRTPWLIVALGAGFNLVNGYLIGCALFVLGPRRDLTWLLHAAFILGLGLFLAGMALNLDSDHRLFELRRGRSGYSIPHGGGFRWVSCPNYLGEIIEWSGFALATWSLGALVFVWWTVANLAPRSWAHHGWYRREFPDYPAERRCLVPWLW